MIWGTATLLVVISVLLLAAIRKVEYLQGRIAQHRIDHESCHAGHERVVEVLTRNSHRQRADVLRSAAIAWESIEEQAHLRELANKQYKIGGPSMPVIWLLDRADRIEKETIT